MLPVQRISVVPCEMNSSINPSAWRTYLSKESRQAVREKIRGALATCCNNNVEEVLDMAASIEEEVLFASSLGRLDYFKGSFDYEMLVKKKRRELMSPVTRQLQVKRQRQSSSSTVNLSRLSQLGALPPLAVESGSPTPPPARLGKQDSQPATPLQDKDTVTAVLTNIEQLQEPPHTEEQQQMHDKHLILKKGQSHKAPLTPGVISTQLPSSHLDTTALIGGKLAPITCELGVAEAT